MLLKANAVTDTTIIAAPGSTNNATRARDPEMKLTRKGNQWYFGMKVHIGTDMRGIVHTLTTTDAGPHDSTQLAHLLNGQESVLYCVKAYENADTKTQWEAEGGRYRVYKRSERRARRGAFNAAGSHATQ